MGPLSAGSAVEVQVTGRGSVPATGVSAVVLKPPPSRPQAPATSPPSRRATPPVVSDLNYTTGEIRPNLVVVKVGAGGRVTLFTSTAFNVVFDIAGYFT